MRADSSNVESYDNWSGGANADDRHTDGRCVMEPRVVGPRRAPHTDEYLLLVRSEYEARMRADGCNVERDDNWSGVANADDRQIINRNDAYPGIAPDNAHQRRRMTGGELASSELAGTELATREEASEELAGKELGGVGLASVGLASRKKASGELASGDLATGVDTDLSLIHI